MSPGPATFCFLGDSGSFCDAFSFSSSDTGGCDRSGDCGFFPFSASTSYPPHRDPARHPMGEFSDLFRAGVTMASGVLKSLQDSRPIRCGPGRKTPMNDPVHFCFLLLHMSAKSSEMKYSVGSASARAFVRSWRRFALRRRSIFLPAIPEPPSFFANRRLLRNRTTPPLSSSPGLSEVPRRYMGALLGRRFELSAFRTRASYYAPSMPLTDCYPAISPIISFRQSTDMRDEGFGRAAQLYRWNDAFLRVCPQLVIETGLI